MWTALASTNSRLFVCDSHNSETGEWINTDSETPRAGGGTVERPAGRPGGRSGCRAGDRATNWHSVRWAPIGSDSLGNLSGNRAASSQGRVRPTLGRPGGDSEAGTQIEVTNRTRNPGTKGRTPTMGVQPFVPRFRCWFAFRFMEPLFNQYDLFFYKDRTKTKGVQIWFLAFSRKMQY